MSTNNVTPTTPVGSRRLRSGRMYERLGTAISGSESQDSDSSAATVADENNDSDNYQAETETGEENLEEETLADDDDGQNELEEQHFLGLWRHISMKMQRSWSRCHWETRNGMLYWTFRFMLTKIFMILCASENDEKIRVFPWEGKLVDTWLAVFFQNIFYADLVCERLVASCLGYLDLVNIFLADTPARGFFGSVRRAWRKSCREILEPLMFLPITVALGCFIATTYQSCNELSTAMVCAFLMLWLFKTVIDGFEGLLEDRGHHLPLFTAILTPITLSAIVMLWLFTCPCTQRSEYAQLYSPANIPSVNLSTVSTAFVGEQISFYPMPVDFPSTPDKADDVFVTSPPEHSMAQQFTPEDLERLEDPFDRITTKYQPTLEIPLTPSDMIKQQRAQTGFSLRLPTGNEENVEPDEVISVEHRLDPILGLRGLPDKYLRLRTLKKLHQSYTNFTARRVEKTSQVHSAVAQEIGTAAEPDERQSGLIPDKPGVNETNPPSESSFPSIGVDKGQDKLEDDQIPLELSEEEIMAQMEAELHRLGAKRPTPVESVNTYRYTGRDGSITDRLHRMVYWSTFDYDDDDYHTVVVYTPKSQTVATWRERQLNNPLNPFNLVRWGLNWAQADVVTTRDAYEDEVYSIKRAEATSAARAAAEASQPLETSRS